MKAYATTVAELVSEWESQDQRPSPEELCAKHPSLLSDVRDAIEKRQNANLAMSSDGGVYASTVHDVLSKLSKLERQGLAPTPEELCKDYPEAEHPNLLSVVRSAVKNLRQAKEVMHRSTVKDDDAPEEFTIAGYEIHEMIGRGGQGAVYRGTQLGLNRQVAVKVLHTAAPRQLARFRREALLLAQLRHPGIVWAIDMGKTSQGAYFLAMEYIEGESLDTYAKTLQMHRTQDGRLRGLELFAKVCEAMGAVHTREIIHRDLKPQNIRVDMRGQPYILDFGLARDEHANEQQQQALTIDVETARGQFMGTLAWASPEQVRGKWDEVGPATDVYSLGVVLYQLLTGGMFPYNVRGTMYETMNHICESTPVPMKTFQKRALAVKAKDSPEPSVVDEKLEAIVLKALAKSSEDRYPTANEMAADIRGYMSGTLVAPLLAPVTKSVTRSVARTATKTAVRTPTKTATRAAAAPTHRTITTPDLDESEEFNDAPPVKRRRGASLVLATLITLAVVGTGSYFAWPHLWPYVAPYFQQTTETPIAQPGQPGASATTMVEPAAKAVVPTATPVVDSNPDPRPGTHQTLNAQLTISMEQFETLERLGIPTPGELGATLQTTGRLVESLQSPGRTAWSANTKSDIEQEIKQATAATQAANAEITTVVAGWVNQQRDRTVELPLPELHEAWTTRRDALLEDVTTPTFTEAMALHDSMEQGVTLAKEAGHRLADRPAYAGPDHPAIVQHLRTSWETLVGQVARQVADGDAAAVQAAQDGVDAYRKLSQDFAQADTINKRVQALVRDSLAPAGLNPAAWEQLRTDLSRAEELGKTLPLADLFAESGGGNELLQAHEAATCTVLATLAKDNRRTETVLECSRRAEKLTASPEATSREQIPTALAVQQCLHRLLNPAASEKQNGGIAGMDSKTVEALRQESRQRLIGLLQAWGRTETGADSPEGQAALVALSELVQANQDWLPLQAAELLWLKFNAELRPLKQSLPAGEAALKARKDALLDLAGQMNSSWKANMNEQLDPRIWLGPSSKQIIPTKEGQRFRVWLEPTDKQASEKGLSSKPLDFVLVQGSGGAADFFLLTTELTIQDVILCMGSGQQWEQLYAVLPSPPARSKPWFWSWTGAEAIDVAVDGIPQLSPPITTDVKQLRQFPMTHVPPAAAIQIAASLGCRLPTSAEWQAAVAQTRKDWSPEKDLRPRLRGAAWSSNARRGVLLDEGIFVPQNMDNDKLHEATWSDESLRDGLGKLAQGLPGQDGVLYRQVADGPNIQDIIGNVAEFVLDGRPVQGSSQPTDARALSAWLEQSNVTVGVVGGSAFSPPGLDPLKTSPVSDLSHGYSDVGLRLVFDSPQVPLRRRMELLIPQLRYAGPDDQAVSTSPAPPVGKKQ